MAASERSKRRPRSRRDARAERGSETATSAGAEDRDATTASSDVDAATRPRLAPGLYLLATPIGAADDVTLRGLDALRHADALACEDSRVLRRLLDLHAIPVAGRPIIVYHDHNAAATRPQILARIEAGESVVYASDAGTPLIADPGYRLVREAYESGAAVTALPGPSALLVALTLSGLPTDRFSFCGFLPPKRAARRAALGAWEHTPGTLVFFEAPHRLAEALTDMAEVLGAREAAVARELTKKFEEVVRDQLPALATRYAAAAPKGEIVVVVGPPPTAEASEDAIDAALRARLADHSLKDAVRTVAEHLSAPRKMVYSRALELTKRDES